jgi:DNA polymerase-3 subunit beta
MKIIALRQNLMDAINVVQKAVMAKATLPVLEGIYLEAGESLKMIGNCFDLGIEYNVEADIKQKGSIVIEARMLGEIIRKLPDAPVAIEVVEGNRVRIECLNSFFEIRGMDGNAYPLLPLFDDEKEFNISQAVLKELIRQTKFAVGTDENRKIMTGALMEAAGGELRIVALDGFRMAVSNAVIKEDIEFKVVIPGKNMNEILRVLETSDEDIRIAISGSLVSFILKNCRIVSKVLEGDFMNYRNYIPTQFETIIKVKTREIEQAIERASLMTSDDRKYPVKFMQGDERLTITSTTEIGTSKEEIIVENEGNDIQIGFNPKYFLDALKVVNDEEIKVSFTSPVGPCVITPLDNDKFLFLILPVRIKN